jgi:hypothetical protein
MIRASPYQTRFCKILLVAGMSILSPAPLHAQYERAEAPFGDKVSERIPAYHRAAPTVALAGSLGRLGIMEAKAVGFRSILNLGSTTSPAGLDDPQMAAYVLLRYHSVALSERLPTEEQIVRIQRILDASENAPILMYGPDRDLVAATWTLVRHASGVPAKFALQEGLTAGLRDRLPEVRQRVGITD